MSQNLIFPLATLERLLSFESSFYDRKWVQKLRTLTLVLKEVACLMVANLIFLLGYTV